MAIRKSKDMLVLVDGLECELLAYEQLHDTIDMDSIYDDRKLTFRVSRNNTIEVVIKQTRARITITNPEHITMYDDRIEVRGIFKRYEPLSEWQLAYCAQYNMDIEYNSDDRLKTVHAITFRTGFEKGYDSKSRDIKRRANSENGT